ncbi:phage tail protein [Devosia sp.]|uniref:phage tail protein n=1 Tax=Devosia sp. TaxID=1871048 RepID=UPI001AD12153|nr:phage tail protein [Devosia sp.]MBN9333854.1 hypothetical protein [Devosia sp.]
MNFLFQLFVYLVLAVIGSILQSAEAQQQKATSGVRGSRQEGGDNSQAFVIGKYGLAGQFEYWADWGQDNGTPNAFHSEVYSLGDLSYSGFTGFYYNGAKGTLLYGEPHGELGIPVAEARVNGKDHLWVKFYDGRQASADAMLVARTAGQERPWTADMIFVGCPYAVVTVLDNRSLFTGFPKYLFEVQGIPLYDMSRDSSVGGVGPQRLDDPSTWAYSDDPIVAASNVLLGIRYQGEWMYGGQTTTAYQLPAANWIAQINKSKARGFTCGYEVVCGEDEPQAVIGEFLMAAAARIAEIGGLYKVLVAEPDAPVRTFTDEDFVIDDDQELDPFPGLESTANVISSSYPEPAEAWGMKQAPSRYSSALEVEDGGRRLPKPIVYKAVHKALQVQELDKLAIEEARRFRTHINTMPPEWWEMEPLDTEAWTSARNGYVDKWMLITAIDDMPNGLVVVGRREVEPADYDWEPGMALPWQTSPLGIQRPAPQIMTGWNAAPYAVVDADGVGRRPGIQVFWAAGLQDVRSVQVQVRESWGGKNVIFDGELPYDILNPAPSGVPSIAVLLPNTPYEVRGKYLPFTGRATLWSNQSLDGGGDLVEGTWITVLTPSIRLGASDIALDLSGVARDVMDQLGATPRQLREVIRQLGTIIEEVDRENYTKRDTMLRQIRGELDQLEAGFVEFFEIALGPGGAIAQALESLYAAMGGNSAEVNIRWTAEAAPTGYAARYAIQAAVNDGTFRAATFFLDVPADPSQPTRIGFMAGNTVFYLADGTPIALFDDEGNFRNTAGTVMISMLTGGGGDFSFG